LIQKKQDLRPARRSEAGKKLILLILVQKHTFSRPDIRLDNETC